MSIVDDARDNLEQKARSYAPTAALDLKDVRRRIGKCKCGGFLELSRDQDYSFVVAVCIACSRETEVTA